MGWPIVSGTDVAIAITSYGIRGQRDAVTVIVVDFSGFIVQDCLAALLAMRQGAKQADATSDRITIHGAQMPEFDGNIQSGAIEQFTRQNNLLGGAKITLAELASSFGAAGEKYTARAKAGSIDNMKSADPSQAR